jgi:hypothetical protein
VERGCGGVRGRGALLGPEESGRLVRDGLFSLGHSHTGFGVVGGWGRLPPNCWWVHLMGGLFPLMVCSSGVW